MKNSLAPFDEDGIREEEEPMPIKSQLIGLLQLSIRVILAIAGFFVACAVISKFIYFLITNN